MAQFGLQDRTEWAMVIRVATPGVCPDCHAVDVIIHVLNPDHKVFGVVLGDKYLSWVLDVFRDKIVIGERWCLTSISDGSHSNYARLLSFVFAFTMIRMRL